MLVARIRYQSAMMESCAVDRGWCVVGRCTAGKLDGSCLVCTDRVRHRTIRNDKIAVYRTELLQMYGKNIPPLPTHLPITQRKSRARCATKAILAH